MDLNPRMSTVRPTPNPKTRGRREEEDSYLILPEREIADCISDLGLELSIVDIQKPQAQTIQRVFEYFVELCMNSTRDVVAPAMKAAADEIGGQYSEIYAGDTLDIMGFFVNLRKLVAVCGIHDFQLQDLFRPTRERVVKQFSYIINFLRFRQAQSAIMDEHFEKAEKTKQRIETLYAENQAKEDILAQLERNRKSAEAMIRDRETRNNELKSQLLELQRVQVRVMERQERARNEQTRMKTLLEDKAKQTMTAKQEAQKLRPYTTQSPDALEKALKDLNATLTNDKVHIDALERRVRALQTSTDSFSTVTADIDACTTLLHELSRDLAAEDATLAAAAKNRDALSERSNNVRDVEREERQLQKQLENVQAKTKVLWQRADERKEVEKRKMDELKLVNEGLKRERGESQRDIERRRVRIEQTEKKMADLKENIENEIHSAHDKYLTMDSHIRLYIKEMEQSIA